MNLHPAQFARPEKNKAVTCLLCPHVCLIQEGAQGICNVRLNKEGVLYSKVYGKNAGLAIDSIEKKPLYHFLPGSKTLSFGTTGCNLNCAFCQNWQLSKSKDTERLISASPQKIAQKALQQNCLSVACTYNDPIVFAEYAIDTAIECQHLGIKTVAVSAGYISKEACSPFFKHMDAVNIDLKSFNNSFYQRLTKSTLQPVLDTLIYIKHQTNCWLEITTLLIPNENDSAKEITQLSQWIVKNLGDTVPLHFSAFHPSYHYKHAQTTPRQTCIKARNIAIDNGLKYVYTGNIVDKEGSTTFCDHCHKVLIKRQGFALSEFNLIQNRCKFCKTICSGIF